MNGFFTSKPWFAVGETTRLKGDGINSFGLIPCVVKRICPTRNSFMYEVEIAESASLPTIRRRVSQKRLARSPSIYHKSFDEMIASLKAGVQNK